MKKLRCIIILFALFQLASGQEAEISNKFILGGSVNFLIQNNTYPFLPFSTISGPGGISSNSISNSKNTVFSITPYFGKEISQKLFAGVQVDYRLGRFSGEEFIVLPPQIPMNFERNSNQLGFGVFTRHILNPSNQFAFFVQPYFQYNLMNEKIIRSSNLSHEEKANYFELGAGLGLMYDINDKIRANLRSGGLRYINGSWKIENTDTKKDFSSFGLNLNLSTIQFGFEFRI